MTHLTAVMSFFNFDENLSKGDLVKAMRMCNSLAGY
jgi:hypothetical protein